MDVRGLIFAPLLASDFGGLAYLGIVMLLIAGCVLLSIFAFILLLVAVYRLRDTTLVAPLAWLMFSLVLWAYAAAAPLRDAQGTPLPADRQTIVAIALLSMACPAVAVLGARRPQNRIWQLAVASLLVILILPELPNVLGQGDRQLTHSLWKWFFAGLLFVGWLNYLPTRLLSATTLWCLPGLSWAWNGAMHWWLILAPGLACTIGVLLARRWRSAPECGWNLVWRDFRNLYGVVWALRVMERSNALANSVGAAVALDWWGFYAVEPSGSSPNADFSGPVDSRQEPAPQEMAKVEAGLRNLLRRFVSNQWIDERLAAPAPPAAK